MESVPSVLEPLGLSEVESGEEEEESLFDEEPCQLSPAPASLSLYGTRRPHSSMGGLASSLLEGLTAPLPPTRRPRQRTLSTNAAIRRERSFRPPELKYLKLKPCWGEREQARVGLHNWISLLRLNCRLTALSLPDSPSVWPAV